jgi:hypothetical protein
MCLYILVRAKTLRFIHDSSLCTNVMPSYDGEDVLRLRSIYISSRNEGVERSNIAWSG